jgi:hypothetical protein
MIFILLQSEFYFDARFSRRSANGLRQMTEQWCGFDLWLADHDMIRGFRGMVPHLRA